MSDNTTPTPPDGNPRSELYNRASLDRLIARFQHHFPSLDSKDYRDEERFYKDAFAARLRELLSREALGGLIAAGDFEAAKSAVMQACGGSVVTPTGYRQANNLLNQWDRLPILNSPAEEVARRMYGLLHGDGPFDARFEAWVELLAQQKPGVWAPATYFLMLHDPAEHLMVKPSQWQHLIKETGINLSWPTRPNATVYSWIRSIARQLLADLAPLGARDLIDVQSFLWRILPDADKPDDVDEEAAMLDDEATASEPDDSEKVSELSTWQRTIDSYSPFVRDIARRYPTWLTETFGSRLMFVPYTDQRFGVFLDSKRVQWGRMNKRGGISIALPGVKEGPVFAELQTLNPVPTSWGIKFTLQNEDDYTQLQRAMRLLGGLPALGSEPEPDDDDETADELVTDSLAEWRAGRTSQHPLVRRALDDYPVWLQQTFGDRLQLQLFRRRPRIGVFIDNRWHHMVGFNTVKNGLYIRLGDPQPSDLDELRRRLSRPDSLREREDGDQSGMRFFVETEGDYALLKELVQRAADRAAPTPAPQSELPATRQPTLYTDAETQFWRIHFPRERWPEAHRHGVIAVGWPLDSTNQSVRRFQRIKAGDRVVAYVQGGMVGGVGIVTHPFDLENPRAGVPAEVMGEDFNQCIRVAWAESPAEPADIGPALRHPHYRPLYNKVKNLNTVVALQPDDYAMLLSLLQVDDPQPAGADSRLPSAWSQLGDFIGFVRGLGLEALDAETILAAARSASPPAGALADADELVAELLQLRLLTPAGGQHYRAQPYVAGEQGTLLRLCALALLVPVEGTTDEYLLPARAILPRMLQTSGPQAPERFAPELGADGSTLLRWYGEAGLIQLADGAWQPAPDALAPLPGADLASTMCNQLVDTLRAEQAGQLATDLPPVTDTTPLHTVADLDARLHELGQELLIDAAVVRRIYRSLLAGRHVVLSGPPGTGKTELARRLPSLLWREEPQTFRRITLRPEQPPVTEASEQRHGYAPIVVTATEDWGVRDVVGGIGPRLDGQSGAISYTIEHGALTRVVLQHYAGTEGGRRLPATGAAVERRDYRHEDGRRYRGAWLVIDEFTRAPVDAAFGSLLTTLSGAEEARLSVPTAAGEPRELPLPRDFRIIGTLNSFDRHFLNQISEAMKRRFDFIDVLPPGPADGVFEQGVAAMQALRRLRRNGFDQIAPDGGEPPIWRWPGVLSVEPTTDAAGLRRYQVRAEQAEAAAALDSFWRLFSAIRVFRQLGTAQIVAVYTNLLAGALVGMGWAESIDTALADALADQLQVLARDEQRTIDAVVEHAGSPADFVSALRAIMRELPPGRRAGYLHALRERDAAANGSSDIGVREDAQPSDAQLLRMFAVDTPLLVPKLGVFRRRLRDLIGERGL